jgi:hypothetical protein
MTDKQERIERLVEAYVLAGCRIALLGKAKMPDGYALLLNADESHYFWIRSDGAEGPIHWNKWSARKMAIANQRVTR